MDGRTVLVTGGNGGIGRAVIEKFAEKGYSIVAHTRRERAEFDECLEGLQKTYGVKTSKAIFDVTDSDAMKAEIRRLRSEKIEIDTLVNCAGVAGGNLLAITPLKEIRQIFDVNLFSYMELAQLLIKPMIRRKQGSIVNIASFEGINLYPGNSGYGVSKAAVIAWTKVLAKEVGDFGIRVNAVAPGFVDTQMARHTGEQERNRMLENNAFKRLAAPKEIADAVYFLASDNASFITGEVLRVDGGML